MQQPQGKPAQYHDLSFTKICLRWPKMDLTNARSMELFRRLGLADDLRRQGTSLPIELEAIFSTDVNLKVYHLNFRALSRYPKHCTKRHRSPNGLIQASTNTVSSSPPPMTVTFHWNHTSVFPKRCSKPGSKVRATRIL